MQNGRWNSTLSAIVSDYSVYDDDHDEGESGVAGDGGDGGVGGNVSTSLPILRLHIISPPIDQLSTAVPSFSKRYHVS